MYTQDDMNRIYKAAERDRNGCFWLGAVFGFIVGTCLVSTVIVLARGLGG